MTYHQGLSFNINLHSNILMQGYLYKYIEMQLFLKLRYSKSSLIMDGPHMGGLAIMKEL